MRPITESDMRAAGDTRAAIRAEAQRQFGRIRARAAAAVTTSTLEDIPLSPYVAPPRRFSAFRLGCHVAIGAGILGMYAAVWYALRGGLCGLS